MIKIAKCQYRGGYFIPRTRRKTRYCDRIIKDGKTCKQIAPYKNHKKLASSNRVVAEFDLSKGRMLRRLERTGIDKKVSPIDISDEDFCRWLAKATDAKNHYIAGRRSEEEAIHMIHMPTIQELRENDSRDLALETSEAQSQNHPTGIMSGLYKKTNNLRS